VPLIFVGAIAKFWVWIVAAPAALRVVAL